MKILMISTVRYGTNGVSTVIKNMISALDKGIYEVDLCFFEHSDREKVKRDFPNHQVWYVPKKNRNTYSYLSSVNKIMKNKKYDVLHIHGNSHTMALELYLAKKNGIKKRIPHSHNTTTKYKFLHKALTRLFNQTYTDAVACGKLAGKWLYGDREFEIIPNGINIDEYKFDSEIRADVRKRLGINEDDFLIGHIGSFSKEKNQTYLIDLLNELSESNNKYRLILIGAGVEESACKDKVSELKLEDRVIFYGLSSNVNNLLQAMDAFVLPSKFEGFPLVIVEAQASDLRCYVSTNVSSEVKLTDKLSFFDLDKPSLILEEIKDFSDAPDMRNDYRSYNKLKGSEYDNEMLNQILDEIYLI